jgi:hypothetical protein
LLRLQRGVPEHDRAAIYRPDGSELLDLRQRHSEKSAAGYWKAQFQPVVLDLDGDGVDEYCYETYAEINHPEYGQVFSAKDGTEMHFADLAGGATTTVKVPVGEEFSLERCTGCADLNGDGRRELLFTTGLYDFAADRWTTFMRYPDSQYYGTEEKDLPEGYYFAVSFAALPGDFDHDGQTDIVLIVSDMACLDETDSTAVYDGPKPNALWLLDAAGKLRHRICLDEPLLGGPPIIGRFEGATVLHSGGRDHLLLQLREGIRISQ